MGLHAHTGDTPRRAHNHSPHAAHAAHTHHLRPREPRCEDNCAQWLLRDGTEQAAITALFPPPSPSPCCPHRWSQRGIFLHQDPPFRGAVRASTELTCNITGERTVGHLGHVLDHATPVSAYIIPISGSAPAVRNASLLPWLQCVLVLCWLCLDCPLVSPRVSTRQSSPVLVDM